MSMDFAVGCMFMRSELCMGCKTAVEDTCVPRVTRGGRQLRPLAH